MGNEPEQSLEQAIWQTLTDHGVTTNKAELVQALIDTFDKFADAPRTEGARRKRKPDLILEALARICKMWPSNGDFSTLTELELGQLRKYTKQLKQARATPQQVDGFAPDWYANDWRGQKRQPPKPADVVKGWTVYLTRAGVAGENVGAKWQNFMQDYRAGAK